MQTEQKDNTIVKRPRRKNRALTEEKLREHRNEISRNHYNRHKDDIEWYQNKVDKISSHQTPKRHHEIKENQRKRYYLQKYGNLDKYKPKLFINS